MNRRLRDAFRVLLDAQEEYGSKCESDSRWVQEPLPSEKQAFLMCWGCPLMGDTGPCKAYAETAKSSPYGVFGVYNGQVYNSWPELDEEGDF